jgi:hypothetical protein
MKKFITGFIAGFIIAGSVVAYAAVNRITLLNSAERQFGKSNTPMYMRTV